jgi:hypothetical protein
VVRQLAGSAAAAGRDIRLRYAAAPTSGDRDDRGIWVASDRELLEPALQALMSFALRHGSPGAVLEVEVTRCSTDAVSLVLRIDEGQDGGLSVWHAFGDSGTRLTLENYLALLAVEAYGGSIGPRSVASGGHELELRFIRVRPDEQGHRVRPDEQGHRT